MKLYNIDRAHTCRIERITLEPAIIDRLRLLGIAVGDTVRIINKKPSGSMIVKTRGTELALGRRIASGIEVSAVEK